MLDVSTIEIYQLITDTPKVVKGKPFGGFEIHFERVSAYELYFVDHEETVVWVGLGILVSFLLVIGYKIRKEYKSRSTAGKFYQEEEDCYVRV